MTRSLEFTVTELCVASCILVLLGFFMGVKSNTYSLFTYYVMPLVARFVSDDHVSAKKKSLKERDAVLESINHVVPKHMVGHQIYRSCTHHTHTHRSGRDHGRK